MGENSKPASSETFQEGTAPVQAFTSPVVRPAVGADLAPRLGRPPKVTQPRSCESKITAGLASTGVTITESSESANRGSVIGGG